MGGKSIVIICGAFGDTLLYSGGSFSVCQCPESEMVQYRQADSFQRPFFVTAPQRTKINYVEHFTDEEGSTKIGILTFNHGVAPLIADPS